MSSDEQSDKECPLCMEAFDEDINFFPCNCQYQICRFCWHRLRTEDTGLCPGCRQPFPEDPVNFQPLSSEQIKKIKTAKKKKKLRVPFIEVKTVKKKQKLRVPSSTEVRRGHSQRHLHRPAPTPPPSTFISGPSSGNPGYNYRETAVPSFERFNFFLDLYEDPGFESSCAEEKTS